MFLKEILKNRKFTKNIFYWRRYSALVSLFRGENFGDYLSTIVVAEMARKLGFKSYNSNKRLLAVGSILHFMKDGDVIWGSGINGKINFKYKHKDVDIRMTRGPLTKKILEEAGIKSPNVFGDPVLLMPILFPEFKYIPKKGKVIFIPNLYDFNYYQKIPHEDIKFVSPVGCWKNILEEILTSELVLTSSLHGLILSESFGVPVRLVPSKSETTLKYQDYLLSTGRDLDLENALKDSFSGILDKTSGVSFERPVFDIDKIIKSFPVDLFN